MLRENAFIVIRVCTGKIKSAKDYNSQLVEGISACMAGMRKTLYNNKKILLSLNKRRVQFTVQ